MTDTPKISAFIVTLNEAATIESAIQSVSSLDEVIVVDSGSNDGTCELAVKLGARVIYHEWEGFAKQKAFAMQQCKYEWCINIDGDEVIPAEALNEIRKVICSGNADYIRVPFEDVFMGKPMHPLSRKRSIVRGFKRSRTRYPMQRLVHENVIEDGPVAKTGVPILHYGYDGVEKMMQKHTKYAALMARYKFQQQRHGSLIKLGLVFPLIFLKVYLLRRLILSGRRGFVQSVIEAMYAFLKEATLIELDFRANTRKDPHNSSVEK